MGAVVAARHPEMDQLVAVKLMLPKALAIPNAAERFVREWRVLSQLRSQYIPRVLDVGTHDGGLPFLVMEYLHGIDVSKLLRKCFHLRVSEAAAFMIQACIAMNEAHGKGIIHRDLKPSNLFLTLESDGTTSIKVLDFGISKMIDRGDGSKLETTTMGTMGSPAYMSPEQAKSAKLVDERSDIWSLGAILYHLVTGELPFRAESTAETLAMILYQEPAPMLQLAAWVTPELEAVVRCCLAKDPDRRFQSACELAEALVPFTTERDKTGEVTVQTVPWPGGQTSTRVVYQPQAVSRIFPHIVPTASFDLDSVPSYAHVATALQSREDLGEARHLQDDVIAVSQRLPTSPGRRKGRWGFPIALAVAFFIAMSLSLWWPSQSMPTAESPDRPATERSSKRSSRAAASAPVRSMRVRQEPAKNQLGVQASQETGSDSESARNEDPGDDTVLDPDERAEDAGVKTPDIESAESDEDAFTLESEAESKPSSRASKRRKARKRAERRRKKRAEKSLSEPKKSSTKKSRRKRPSDDNPFPDIF